MTVRPVTLVALAALAASSIACSSKSANESGSGALAGNDAGGSDTNDLFTAGTADPCKSGLKTPYLNDELCLEPPAEAQGFQMHFGPAAGTDYDNPDAIAPFLLQPGDEGVLCQSAMTPNTDKEFSQEQHIRIRSGTHHIIFWRAVQPVPDIPEGTLLPDNCRQNGYSFFVGSEAGLTDKGGRLDIPLPGATSAYGPEDVGVAQSIEPNTKVWIETHFVNTSEKPMLREVWANIVYADKAKVTTVMDPIFWIGGAAMNVPPGQRQVVPAGPAVPPKGASDVRLMGIAGHVHAHTARESVFLNHADGTKELVYETFNWAEPLFAQFDSVHQNPATGTVGRDGARSGKLIFAPGDTMTWECEVNNTTQAALKFADRAYDAEMCNVFGYFTPGNGTTWNAFSP